MPFTRNIWTQEQEPPIPALPTQEEAMQNESRILATAVYYLCVSPAIRRESSIVAKPPRATSTNTTNVQSG